MVTDSNVGGEKPKRRVGGDNSVARTAILDGAQALMIDDGYAAVTARRVAAAAGVKPALVQYYFPTMDDLLLAVYRRAADQVGERQAAALASDRPLHALWELLADDVRTTLAVEFMALANHRKAIRAEIARYAAGVRQGQETAMACLAAALGSNPDDYPPAGVSLLLAGAARALVMERGLGISSGHAEARAIIERLLERVEPLSPDRD